MCVLLLAVMALMAPLAELAHCDGGHADECSAECVCACHYRTPLASPGPAFFSDPGVGNHVEVAVLPSVGRRALADIFRPPACA